MDPANFLVLFNLAKPSELCDLLGVSRPTLYRMKNHAHDLVMGKLIERRGPGGQEPLFAFKVPRLPKIAADPVTSATHHILKTNHIMYSVHEKSYYVFQNPNHHWVRDPRGAIVKRLIRSSVQSTESKFVLEALQDHLSLESEQERVSKLDSDTSYIAFENGVYSHQDRTFKAGTPGQMQSRCANCMYDENADTTDAEELLKRIFPDTGEREYVLEQHARWLLGNMDKSFIVMYGVSNTMKSTVARLMQLTFGKLVESIPEQTLTRTRPLAANVACPHLIPAMKARIVYVNELPENASINASIVKAFSGHDLVSFRDTRGQQLSHVFRCQLCLISNHAPNLGHDRALHDRVHAIHFAEVQDRASAMNAHELETYLERIKKGWANLLVQTLMKLEGSNKNLPPRFAKLKEQWISI